MAVVQVVFKHRRPTCARAESAARKEDFSYQLRRLAIAEANVWQTGQDLLVEWGDPAQPLNVAKLRGQIEQGQAESVFGRSWIHYRHASHVLTLAVDRLGLFPILLAQRNGATYLASDALALSQLLGHTAYPAAEALLEMLAYGQLLGSQATLESVLHLHAGSVAEVRPQGAYYLHHSAPPALQGSGEADPLEALVAAVDKRMRHDPETLLLFDAAPESVLLLAAAQAAGHRPGLLACGAPHSPALQGAEALADATGARLFSAGVGGRQDGAAVAQLGAGEIPLNHPHLLMCPELVARTRGATLLTTTGAGTFRGAYYTGGMPGFELLSLPSLKAPLLKNAKHYVYQAFAATLEPICQAFPALAEMLRERLEQRLAVYQPQAADAAHYLDAVYLGEHVRRQEIAAQQLLARDYARSHPFLDAEVLPALAGLPAYWRAGGRFYRHAAARLSPELARLAWDTPPIARRPEWLARLGAYLLPSWEAANTPARLPASADQLYPLRHALQACALPEGEIQRGIGTLLHGPARGHALGVLSAYGGWLQHLLARQSALLAQAG